MLPLLLILAASCGAQEFKNIQEMMDFTVARYRMVGADAGLFIPMGFLSRARAGERVYGSGVPVGEEDMYIMGSAGKSMTSTMAARVVAQGHIRWNSTTKEIFQDTGLFDVHPSYHNSTLESFVSHGSGAPGLDTVVDKYHAMVDVIFNSTSWQPEHDNRPERIFLSRTLLQDPVTVTPGTFLYSIGGFTVAGAMLELATGNTFEQLMTEELFEPLGMTGCGFGPTTVTPSMPPTQPWGHLGDSWAAHVMPVPPSPWANVASSMVPDGGLHCSLASWQRYLAAHLREDPDFLPPSAWQYIHTGITPSYGGGSYGFGWFMDHDDTAGRILQHGGTDGHNFAQAFLLPDLGLGMVVATNNGGTMGRGSRQAKGFESMLEWIFTHPAGLAAGVGEELGALARDSWMEEKLA